MRVKTGLRDLWDRLSIKRKLVTVTGSLILLMSLVNIYIASNAFRYLHMYEADLEKTAAVHRLQTGIDTANRSFENYVMYGDPAALERFNREAGAIWSLFGIVQQALGRPRSPEDREAGFQVSAIRHGLRAFIQSAETVIGSSAADGPDFVEELLRSRRIYGYLQNYLQNLLRIRLAQGSSLQAEQYSRVVQIRLYSFAGSALITLFFLMIILSFSASISRPLQLLAKRSARIASGDLGTPDMEITGRDELGSLTASFNEMNHKIHQMVESLKEKAQVERRLLEDEKLILDMNRSLREAQLLYLQSQISPHFFFNSMNIISRMAMLEKAPSTNRLIESLSAILRYTLQDHRRFMSLEQELYILREYLHIQSTRYGERLRYSIEVDPLLNPSLIMLPVLTLQPLAENSLKYAIEPREEGGELRLEISRVPETGQVSIVLADDGPGIEPALLAELEKGVRPESTGDDTRGIGLANVRRRMELSYGGASSFAIVCPPSGGTLVRILLPEDGVKDENPAGDGSGSADRPQAPSGTGFQGAP